MRGGRSGSGDDRGARLRDRNVHTSARRLIIVVVLFLILIGVLFFGPMRLVLEQNCKRKADAPSGDVTLVWKWWTPAFQCDYLLPDGRHVVLPWG